MTRPGSILIVEDNSGDVALIRQSLKDHGVDRDIVVLRDGEKAVQYLDQVDAGDEPAMGLVVLDLNLPKVNGRDVLARLRQSASYGNVPVVVFSSSDAAKDKEDVARLGANRYVKKPSNLDDFLKIGGILRTLLEPSGA